MDSHDFPDIGREDNAIPRYLEASEAYRAVI
jgi:hypothetical protein